MRLLPTLLTVGLALATFLPSISAQEPPPTPLITLTPPLVDLGVQLPDIDVETMYELTNRTDHVVFIDSIVGGCPKCLEYKYDGKKIEPGETKEIHVTLHTDSRGSGKFRILVKLTDRDIPEVEAWISYAVIPVLDATPPAIDFGDLVVAEPVEEMLTLTTFVPHSLPEFQLEPFLSGEGPVSVEVGEIQRTAYTEILDQAKLTVTLKANAKAQNLEGFSLLLVFPAGASAELRIPIKGRVVTQRFLQRNRFHLGAMKVGDTRRKTIMIPYASKEEDVIIESVTSNLPELRATARLNKKTKEVILTVHFEAKKVGEISGLVRIKTNLREAPFGVRMAGRVRRRNK